jgi:hypothetical protein
VNRNSKTFSISRLHKRVRASLSFHYVCGPLPFLLVSFLFLTAAAPPGTMPGAKIFAGQWSGTRLQWMDGPPSPLFRSIPSKASGPFEVSIDKAERQFAGFNVSARNGRVISGHRVTMTNGCRWNETATFTVAADGKTAKFVSKSVGLEGPWPCKGFTVENSADLRRVR